MKKIGVLGGTGYVGSQLLSILFNHPGVKIAWVTSEKYSGKLLSDSFPHLNKLVSIRCNSVSAIKDLDPVDLVFSCLPAGFSMNFVDKFFRANSIVIDLSPDLRIKDPGKFKEVFGSRHRYPELLDKAVYGLTEVNRDYIKNAEIVSNPGCYATTALIPLFPLMEYREFFEQYFIIDIKSSLSGAGRAPRSGFHFPESNQNICADNLRDHDQKYEIEHILSDIHAYNFRSVFSTHRVPVNRGILSTLYLKLRKGMGAFPAVDEIMRGYYSESGFVRVLEQGVLPALHNVCGSNYMDIGFDIQEDHLVLVSVLDNLLKGAAGQAVQNMNIILGFDESEGLNNIANYSYNIFKK